jgi:hypothetical protein
MPVLHAMRCCVRVSWLELWCGVKRVRRQRRTRHIQERPRRTCTHLAAPVLASAVAARGAPSCQCRTAVAPRRPRRGWRCARSPVRAPRRAAAAAEVAPLRPWLRARCHPACAPPAAAVRCCVIPRSRRAAARRRPAPRGCPASDLRAKKRPRTRTRRRRRRRGAATATALASPRRKSHIRRAGFHRSHRCRTRACCERSPTSSWRRLLSPRALC